MALNTNGQLLNGWTAQRGYTINRFFDCEIESVLWPDKVIKYRVYENGMIIYNYVKKKKKPEQETEPAYEKEKETQNNITILEVGAGLVAIAALVVGVVLVADDITGVGVADDGIAGASITYGVTYFANMWDKICYSISNLFSVAQPCFAK